MKYCTECGSPLNDNDRFCNICGKKQPSLSAGKTPAEKSAASARPASTGKAQASPAKPAPKAAKKKRGCFSRLLRAAFLIVLLFTGLIKPGFIRNWLSPREPVPSQPSAVQTTAQSGSDMPGQDDFDPETLRIPKGHSRAINSSPCEGFTVTAPENAFKQDTEIRITPVTRDTVVPDAVLTAAEEIEDAGYILIAGHEVNAGLADDEIMPGEYTVSVDLSVLGISPLLYENLCVFRVAEDGSWYEYSADIRDGKLRYASDQNSYLVWGVILTMTGIAYNSLQNAEAERAFEYFYSSNKQKYSFKGKSQGVSYTIYWAPEDLGIDAEPLEKQLRELTEEYEVRKEELYREYDAQYQEEAMQLGYRCSRGKSVSEVLIEALNRDKRYRDLDKKLHAPDPVAYTAECVDRAFEFLNKQEYVKMPTGMVDLISVTTLDSAVLANETARNMNEGYVELNLQALTGADQTKKNDYLLTVTHELLHVCQQKYRYFFADAIRYDEMAAVYMEERALSYFMSKKWIKADAKPTLSSSYYWGTLKLPIDEFVPNDENTGYMKHEGYNLGPFLKYLQEKTGAKLCTGRVMQARSSVDKSDTSEALCRVFDIKAGELEIHYRNFIRENKAEIAKYYDTNEPDGYKRNKEIKLEAGQKTHISVTPLGSYSSEIRGFSQTEKTPMKLLAVYDPDFAAEQPGCELVPVEKFERIPKGLFIYPKEDIKTNIHRDILEIHGQISASEKKSKAGYTVYALAKTGVVTVSEDEDELILQMPKNSLAAADGAIDGYYLIVRGSNDFELKKALKAEYFEKEYRIQKSDILSENDEKVNLTVTLCEYVRKDEKNILLGDSSDAVEYSLSKTTVSGPERFTGVWIPMEYKGNVTSSSWVIGLTYMPEEREFGVYEGTADRITIPGLWAEIRYFEYDERSGVLTIDFTKNAEGWEGTATYRITADGTLIMSNSGGSWEFFRAE